MKTLKYIIIIAIFGLLSSLSAQSQTLKIKRTDVADSNANFVTATYMFGIDIVIEDIENCHLAAFFLTFNHSDYVKFSGYTIGDFSENGEVLQGQIHDPSTNKSTLSLAIYSGENNSVNTNPTLVHLDFVVLQTAPNNDEIEFAFSGAIAETDVSGKEFEVKTENKKFTVHGFDDIWPGDANRDGIVDTKDHAMIGIYLGHGGTPNGKRAFKRKNASTNFYPQRVLVWDESDATFADGDGDGDISLTDGLVVFMNMGKLGEPNNGFMETKIPDKKHDLSNFFYNVPVEISTEEDYKALIGYLDIDEDKYEYLGIKKGTLFENKDHTLVSDIDNNGFLIGLNSSDDKIQNDGIAFEVMLKPKGEYPAPKSIKLIKVDALSTNNYTFPVENYLSTETNEHFDLKIKANQLIINSPTHYKGILKITDLNGKNIYSNNLDFINSHSINLNNVMNGTYFITIIGSGVIHTEKIVL